MSDLQKYIEKRRQTDADFAESYDEGLANLMSGNDFTERAEKDDWEKAREVLAKVPDAEAEDGDKL